MNINDLHSSCQRARSERRLIDYQILPDAIQNISVVFYPQQNVGHRDGVKLRVLHVVEESVRLPDFALQLRGREEGAGSEKTLRWLFFVISMIEALCLTHTLVV